MDGQAVGSDPSDGGMWFGVGGSGPPYGDPPAECSLSRPEQLITGCKWCVVERRCVVNPDGSITDDHVFRLCRNGDAGRFISRAIEAAANEALRRADYRRPEAGTDH